MLKLQVISMQLMASKYNYNYNGSVYGVHVAVDIVTVTVVKSTWLPHMSKKMLSALQSPPTSYSVVVFTLFLRKG